MPNAAWDSPEAIARWHAERSQGIGSSDAPAVAGICPYRTALDVYVDKVYPTEPTGRLPDDPSMRFGLILEPAIARAYELETGVSLAQPQAAKHKLYPYIAATADRIRPDGRLVELKTAGHHMQHVWGEAGTDEIPEPYLVQVQHQMMVYDAPAADVAVLIAGSDFRIYHVERSPSAIECLIAMERDFWAMVERREPPEPDWSHAGTPDLIGKLYRPQPGVEVELPDEFAAKLAIYLEACRSIKDIEAEKSRCKAELIMAMGEAECASLDGYTITRREVIRAAYQVKESTYFDFRVRAPKGALAK